LFTVLFTLIDSLRALSTVLPPPPASIPIFHQYRLTHIS
jgi:hypothetical protein